MPPTAEIAALRAAVLRDLGPTVAFALEKILAYLAAKERAS
jgi:hypothetical protein